MIGRTNVVAGGGIDPANTLLTVYNVTAYDIEVVGGDFSFEVQSGATDGYGPVNITSMIEAYRLNGTPMRYSIRWNATTKSFYMEVYD